jgi:hypothetical protein
MNLAGHPSKVSKLEGEMDLGSTLAVSLEDDEGYLMLGCWFGV